MSGQVIRIMKQKYGKNEDRKGHTLAFVFARSYRQENRTTRVGFRERTRWTERPEQDNQKKNRIVRSGQSKQNSQNRKDRGGHQEQNSQNRKPRTEHPEHDSNKQDSRNRTVGPVWQGQDSQNMTTRKG
jgi:hypothetical protein